MSDYPPKNASDYYGRKVIAAEFAKADNELRLTFEDGVKVRIWDSGQDYSEIRYMTCDDDVSDLVGGILRDVSVETTDDKIDEYSNDDVDVHEVAFLKVATDKATITTCTHNEHNGYYSGFILSLDEVTQA
jgi:hypothetical protein